MPTSISEKFKNYNPDRLLQELEKLDKKFKKTLNDNKGYKKYVKNIRMATNKYQRERRNNANNSEVNGNRTASENHILANHHCEYLDKVISYNKDADLGFIEGSDEDECQVFKTWLNYECGEKYEINGQKGGVQVSTSNSAPCSDDSQKIIAEKTEALNNQLSINATDKQMIETLKSENKKLDLNLKKSKQFHKDDKVRYENELTKERQKIIGLEATNKQILIKNSEQNEQHISNYSKTVQELDQCKQVVAEHEEENSVLKKQLQEAQEKMEQQIQINSQNDRNITLKKELSSDLEMKNSEITRLKKENNDLNQGRKQSGEIIQKLRVRFGVDFSLIFYSNLMVTDAV